MAGWRPRALDEILGFIAVGGANTAVTYTLYLLASQVVFYQVAYAFAYGCGILISYGLNLRYVFRSGSSWRKFLQYPMVYIAQYAVGAASLWILVEWLGVSSVYALFFTIILTLPVTFIFSKGILQSH